LCLVTHFGKKSGIEKFPETYTHQVSRLS
jgi:hypothetical protein